MNLKKGLFLIPLALLAVGCSKKEAETTTKKRDTSSVVTTAKTTTTKKQTTKTEVFDVEFDLNGGEGNIETQHIEKGNKVTKPSDPSKTGFTFNGWKCDGEDWSFVGYTVTNKMTLVADWTPIDYNMTYRTNLNGYIQSEGTTFHYNDSVTVYAIPYSGYSFYGWYSSDDNYYAPISTDRRFTFKMPAKDWDIWAVWTEYFLTTTQNDADAGTIKTPYSNKHVSEGDKITITAESNPGYTFDGWYSEGSLVSEDLSFTYTMGRNNVTLEAKWSNYTLTTTKNISTAGTISEYDNTKITVGSELTITAETNTGYNWVGWYDGETEISKDESFHYTMGRNNVTLEARWTANNYTLTIENQVEGVTITGITSGNEYAAGSEIVLVANNIPSKANIKWTMSDGSSGTGTTFTFIVPGEDVTITTSLIYYFVDGNDYYFGYYPQTLETNEEIKESLNEKAGTLPTKTYRRSWTSYGYTINDYDDYIWYIDIDLDEDGRNDYRGVYFTDYYSSNQETNGYTTDNVYWFKYEIIKWKIYTEEDGKAFLVSDLLLDVRSFDTSSNIYTSSKLRTWLIGDFYKSAFSTDERNEIATTLVYSGSGSPKNDYVFIQNRGETRTFASKYSTSATSGTDYAKALGLYVGNNKGNSSYFTRDKYESDSSRIYVVTQLGQDGFASSIGSSEGVRPAINLVL